MCLRLPFAPGISQAWDSTQVPRHGRPHQVNRRSRERQVQRGSSGSLGRLPFHSSSPPFCDAVRSSCWFEALLSPLLTLHLGASHRAAVLRGSWPHNRPPALGPGLVSCLRMRAQTRSPRSCRVWFPLAAAAPAPAALHV